MRQFMLFALLLLAAPPAAAQPAPVQQAFEAGNRHYAAGEYEAALHQYRAALASGWTSGALHYNAAGAYYRLGRVGQAVRQYEKARLLLPHNERLQHNIGVVRSKLDVPPPARPSVRAAAERRLTALLPPLGYFAIGLGLFLLGLLAWVRPAWVRPAAGAPMRPRGAALALLVAGLAASAMGLALSAGPGTTRAVALHGPLTLRRAPAATADSTAGVPEGTVVRLTERRAGWAHVRSSRGDTGWAPAPALGTL